MSDSRLPATAYVVLGLVSVKPAAGHELAGFAGRSVGNFFPVTRSNVYLELDRLCRLGLLDATEVTQQRLPTKRVYEITAAGGAALQRWLEDVDSPPERMRDLFLVRVFFGDRMTPARMAALLDEYEAAARINRDRLAVLVERLSERPESVFRRSTAMFGVRREQAKLDWVADVRPSLIDAAAGGRDWCCDAPSAQTPC
jgi:DNA-binding PadR family transcriptional regulator